MGSRSCGVSPAQVADAFTSRSLASAGAVWKLHAAELARTSEQVADQHGTFLYQLLEVVEDQQRARPRGQRGLQLVEGLLRGNREHAQRAQDHLEETLRFEPTGPHIARYIAKDVEYYGTTIPAGSAALLLVGSADRDERRFESVDVLDNLVRRSRVVARRRR